LCRLSNLNIDSVRLIHSDGSAREDDMDQHARLAKVEAFVETFREDLDRLHAADERLAEEIAQLREHTDRSLAELRKHVDEGFVRQRDHADQGLAELRKELNTSIRWLIGLVLANTSVTLGLVAKMAGLF
jgi:predicted RNase H-like nuclease (RuvC/YqgF family)